MSKYTISKAFSQTFRFPIWRIEVDGQSKLIALECRDPETTVAYITVIRFNGSILLNHFELPQKEWTLAAIQKKYVILRKISENSPVSPGVWILNYEEPNETYLFHQYQYLTVLKDYIQIRPQHITAGFQQYFSLLTYDILTTVPSEIKPFENDIVFPLEFKGQKPIFLEHYKNNEDLWISKCQDHFLWCFHEKHGENYDIRLLISDKNEIWDEAIIIKHLGLKLVQIYFQIGCQIFLLTHNKREFVSYLV
ncbi:hypothetical protein LZQ00_04935 [Sphingobacterium sp. SRCM116780]|uniref:hypothetical protein n=1 Tax=Sphingobacterium sp. SRCM116780 TaxID=2907623 RepID=UPI001F4610C2|nr:hypothetical protein [Sphingobacterium sp. SRCM116780]UIR57161.1 hypothetical protein LZQ00_04935 [Sphingobacterium sp. SRCM116780]